MSLPKHIVISRKGFDSGTGCIPSPIFEDGTMLSLPIPDSSGSILYGDLSMYGHSYGKLVTDLKASSRPSGKALSSDSRAHLDPDLIRSTKTRLPGWRPAYGQCGKDSTILLNHEVGEGDLFLFYGWFRQCELVNGMYRYVKGAPDLHVIFGYMRVGEVIRLSSDTAPEWASDHPHLLGAAREKDPRNMLFVGSGSLGIAGRENIPGAAAFNRFTEQLQLTATGMTRSWWRLPKWFYPRLGILPLSSHEKNDRWRLEEETCLMQNVSRGQEFILDVQHYPEAVEWAFNIISKSINTA